MKGHFAVKYLARAFSGHFHGNDSENAVNKSYILFTVKTLRNHHTPLQAANLASSLTLAELILCSIVDPNCMNPNPLNGYLLNRDITVM